MEVGDLHVYIWSFLVHFYRVRDGSFFKLVHQVPQLFQHHGLKSLSFHWAGVLPVDLWPYFLGFCSLPLVIGSLFVPVSSYFGCNSSVMYLEAQMWCLMACYCWKLLWYPGRFVFPLWIFEIAFRILLWRTLVFWWRLYWICTLLQVVWTF